MTDMNRTTLIWEKNDKNIRRKVKLPGITRVITSGNIKLNLRTNNKNEAIDQLIQQLEYSGTISTKTRNEITKYFYDNENSCSTGVGQETAFPHVILENFSGLKCCIGICQEGIDFNDCTGQKTKIIFLIINSPEYSGEYLTFLSQIARKIINSDTRSKIIKAEKDSDVIKLLESPVEEKQMEYIL
jgi:mannitol/fructose-specific phosphotransferase system IIA component (Ntr-type)